MNSTQQPQQPQQLQRRNAPTLLPWLIGIAVLVTVALVVGVVLLLDRSSVADSGDEPLVVDLSTPEKAVESFAAAVATGDVDAVYELSCVAHQGCIAIYARSPDDEYMVERERDKLRAEIPGLVDELAGAVFDKPVPGPMTGTVAIGFRTPDTTDAPFLVFAQHDKKWRYAGRLDQSGGAGTPPSPIPPPN